MVDNNPQGINKTLKDWGDFAGSVGYNFSKPPVGLQAAGNFGDTVSGWFSGRTPAAGQGAGDKAARQMWADANAQYPQQAAALNAENAAKNNKLFANAANNTLTNWGKPIDVKTGGKGGTTGGTTGGKVTPLSVAAAMKQALGPQAAAEKARAEQLGLTYTPGQGAGSADKAYQAQVETDRNSAIDSNLGSVYSPLQDLLKAQQDKANKRYEQNKADITSIFGALSGLTAADTARVNKQFTDSITKQQTDYATRVAQQNLEAQAGTQQAIATGAERGSGPAMTNNPIQAAAAQGNADANAALTNWQGLMSAQQNQAVTDVENRGTGYTQQKLGALNQLSRNFEDTLSQFAQQDATLKSQMAQSKIDAQQAYASNDFAAGQAADKQSAALQLQDLKNQGLMNVATLKAKVSLARGGSGSTSLKGIEAIMDTANKTGVDFNAIQSSVQDAYNTAYAAKNPDKTKAGKAPSVQEVKAAWYQISGGSPQRMGKNTPVATGLIENLYK